MKHRAIDEAAHILANLEAEATIHGNATLKMTIVPGEGGESIPHVELIKQEDIMKENKVDWSDGSTVGPKIRNKLSPINAHAERIKYLIDKVLIVGCETVAISRPEAVEILNGTDVINKCSGEIEEISKLPEVDQVKPKIYCCDRFAEKVKENDITLYGGMIGCDSQYSINLSHQESMSIKHCPFCGKKII